jgi:hypothetical protein
VERLPCFVGISEHQVVRLLRNQARYFVQSVSMQTVDQCATANRLMQCE